MTKYERIAGKVFAENASGVGNNPEIGQFGSAKAGTFLGTDDVRTIQDLEAWSQGWTSAVVSSNNYPPLPEMNGVLKVLSYQIAYLLQSGIAEWNSETTYYEYNAVNYKGKFYYSTINNNTTEPETVEGSANWTLIEAPTATSNSKGVVQPDNDTISIENGTLSVSNDVIQTIESKVNLNQAAAASMPASKMYTEVVLGASQATYTAPFDGYLNVGINFEANGWMQISNIEANNFRTALPNTRTATGSAWFWCITWLPFQKGQRAQVAYSINPTITSSFVRWHPLKGDD